jgi:hypothetical protein
LEKFPNNGTLFSHRRDYMPLYSSIFPENHQQWSGKMKSKITKKRKKTIEFMSENRKKTVHTISLFKCVIKYV